MDPQHHAHDGQRATPTEGERPVPGPDGPYMGDPDPRFLEIFEGVLYSPWLYALVVATACALVLLGRRSQVALIVGAAIAANGVLWCLLGWTLVEAGYSGDSSRYLTQLALGVLAFALALAARRYRRGRTPVGTIATHEHWADES